MVENVMVGLMCAPVDGAIAQMKRLMRNIFVMPTYGATWSVLKLPMVV